MNWEEEIDLVPSKKGTKFGRRASVLTPGSPEEIPSATETVKQKNPDIPIRTRKTGWGTEEGNKSKLKSNIIEQERFQNEKSQESDEEIPIIPDIDEMLDDRLNLSDIKVPNVTVKESTYKELDNQFQSGQINFGTLGDIDLSVLTNSLYPEKEVQKCTDIWTMESLYQDLAKQ